LRGKEAWFETDYVVFRRGDECAVARIDKTPPEELFCRISGVEVLSLPDTTRWVDDPSVDTGNASALAAKARVLGVGSSETLVVSGLYEPIVIDVFDLSPPDPPRLVDMTRRVLGYRSFPPIVLRPHIQPMDELAGHVTGRALLFPCGISQLKRTLNAQYLDERPARQDWVLVGCERSRVIHHHFYGEDCPRIELCPRHLFDPGDALALMRCCMVEKRIELCERVVFVPWGAELPLIEDAIAALVQRAIAI
jgi:hypothetical protein